MSNVIDLLTRRPIEQERDWQPAAGECLACFVRRMVERGNCTGTLVWAEHWKRHRSPGASALIGRLERQGGACDCALVTVLWSPTADVWERPEPAGPSAREEVPACEGVRPRSTRPCGLWTARTPATG
jgi:hypothetical protein